MATENYEAIIQKLIETVMASSGVSAEQPAAAPAFAADGSDIPVGVSNRHLHLSQADQDTLFGPGYQMNKIKDLVQPGQFACKETVTVVGPKGAIEKMRVLGPVRKQTQVEILAGDCFKLGVKAPCRMSGDLAGTPGITIVGPCGSIQIPEGVIVAQRHVHMTADEAVRYGVTNGQVVSLQFDSERGGIMNNVAIRSGSGHALECHVDTEEANAFGINGKSHFKIIK